MKSVGKIIQRKMRQERGCIYDKISARVRFVILCRWRETPFSEIFSSTRQSISDEIWNKSIWKL
jgi:hypothetical protein